MKTLNIAQFQEYVEGQFRELGMNARQLLENMNPELFNRQPRPGKWSIGQHIHHLNVTGGLYLEQIKEKIPEQLDTRPAPSTLIEYKPRLVMRKFIEALEPPVKRTFKAPKVFLPAAELDQDAVLESFLSLQEAFIRRLEDVAHFNLIKEKITSPAASLLKLQLGETFLVNIAHEHRHLWHAEEIIEEFR
jgi:hypothetical protein